MGDDGGNGAALAIRRLCLPCLGGDVLDQVLIDAVVSVEGVEQGTRDLAGKRSCGSSRGWGLIFRHILFLTWQRPSIWHRLASLARGVLRQALFWSFFYDV